MFLLFSFNPFHHTHLSLQFCFWFELGFHPTDEELIIKQMSGKVSLKYSLLSCSSSLRMELQILVKWHKQCGKLVYMRQLGQVSYKYLHQLIIVIPQTTMLKFIINVCVTKIELVSIQILSFTYEDNLNKKSTNKKNWKTKIECIGNKRKGIKKSENWKWKWKVLHHLFLMCGTDDRNSEEKKA